jgi:MFS family permease
MSFTADLRSVLRGRDFRRLYATRLTSQASDGAFQIGLASLFFFSPERAADAAGVATAFAVLLLPYSIVGPFAGVFLDRWRRRQVLVWGNVIRAVMIVGVAALVASGIVGLPLYVVVLACLSVNRFYLAGLSAALPHVVDRDDLVMANSVSTTSGTIAAIVGGGLGLGLKTLLGAGDRADAVVILVSAGTFLTASLIASRMHRDLLGPDLAETPVQTRRALRHVAAGLADGARHVMAHPPAGHALAAITAHRFFYGVTTIVAILLYRNYFNDPADVDAGIQGLGYVFAASGFGFFLAALITPEVTHRLSKPRWIVACLLMAAAFTTVYLGWLTEALTVVGAFFAGVAAQGVKICVDTLVQESVDDAYRGRVFSFYDVLFNLSFISAAAFTAAFLPADGASTAVFGVIAGGYALTALLYLRASRSYAGTPGPLRRATFPAADESAVPAPQSGH